MGIEKNVYWVNRAAAVTFDATRVNNLPALDRDDAMREQAAVFDPDGVGDLADFVGSPRRLPPARAIRSYIIPGGTVQAHPTDDEGVVGLTVSVPRNFWRATDLAGHSDAFFACQVVAECVREFRHSDGTRARTYILSHNSQYFPIKRDALLRVCLSAAQRAQLNA